MPALRNSILILLLLSLFPAQAEEFWIKAPNLDQYPAVNQRVAGINFCGPACLLDSYQISSHRWQKKSLTPYRKLKTNKEKIELITRRHGLKRSLKFSNQVRWNKYKGVNIADLGAMANEMRRGFTLPKLEHEIFFRKDKESHQHLLRRIHKKLTKSMKAGFPPIISIRRVANRKLPRSGSRMWMTLQGHFVVITGFPKTLKKDADSLAISYRDPWTGRDLIGKITIPKDSFWAAPAYGDRTGQVYKNPTLVADFPFSKIGIKKVKRGEKHALTLAAAVGAF